MRPPGTMICPIFGLWSSQPQTHSCPAAQPANADSRLVIMTLNKSVVLGGGWTHGVGLVAGWQAVAGENVGHDLGDMVETGGEGRGVGRADKRQ